MTSPEIPQQVELPLYTVADAAKALDVSPEYLYERIRGNEIATVDLGKDGGRQKLRIPANALQAFLQERLTSPAAAA